MSGLSLKPTHKTVQDYYNVLNQMTQLHIDHEMAVRSAFQTLLAKCGQQFDWTLVPEYPVRRPKQMPLKVDGALIDTMRLTQGFWEAKDEHDELEREVEKKLSIGYPDKNIIFQSPRQAILIQRGRVAWKDSIAEPDALVEVLHHFFDYSDPVILSWQEAAERFKTEVPEQSRALKEIIDLERKKNRAFVEAFTAFVETCRQALNPNLSEDAVERMLIQHILTERIFSKVFDNEDFRTRNVVAVEIEKVIATLIKGSFNRGDFLRRLDPFYKAIEQSAANTTGYTEKQEFLNTVYERFFQGFSPKEADTHGIVYTPQPIVDFMVRSVEDILEKEFGKSLADKGVHILDPFVGTGNFITRVMKEIAAKKKSALPYKYANELHCNEIMLLPYYIASMNIEHEYLDATGEYEPFPGICLVDTFELAEETQTGLAFMTEENAARVERQKLSPIFVILGNPPYNMGQVNENDSNKNRPYKNLDKAIAATYAKDSKASLKNKLGDPYVKAICWAASRIKGEGIVAFVTNNSLIDQIAFDGMRFHLGKDFDSLYILNLGGNVRKNPKLSGTTHNVFGIQVGVSINILVRKGSGAPKKANILYAAVDDDWRREQRLKFLDNSVDVNGVEWSTIHPDENNNWLMEGIAPEFGSFPSLGSKETKAATSSAVETIFKTFSLGVATNRDEWVYAFDSEEVGTRVRKLLSNYNAEVARLEDEGPDRFVLNTDAAVIKWTDRLKHELKMKRRLAFAADKVRHANYRPFTSASLYFDNILNQRRYKQHIIFPTVESELENFSICCSAIGNPKPFQALATRFIPDLHFVGDSQCFPFYVYSTKGKRRENITDWVLEQFRSRYADRSITKWDIFHYVYAVLHHPTYRERYAANLKRELPRVPFINAKDAKDAKENKKTFREFVKAGEKLSELHVKYEEQPDATESGRGTAPSPHKLGWMENPEGKVDYRVETKAGLNGAPSR